MDFKLKKCLIDIDPEIYELCQGEKRRQIQGLELSASENYTPRAVLEALGSSFHNKSSRYNGPFDIIEPICKKRCLEAFKLDPEEWGVNVRPYSGSPANFAVFTGLVGPSGRIMGLDVPDGGHLTHGFHSALRSSATSLYFESMPYKVNPETGLIDYEQLEKSALLFRPKILIAGTTCYARNLDYAQLRKIANDCNALLMADMAHIGGLVAAEIIPSPFEYADIVTTTTHKTLRGPRAGVIFYRKTIRQITANGNKVDNNLEKKINDAVYPGLQGGTHYHVLAAIAVAMKLASKPSFIEYQKQVVKNCQQLCKSMQNFGYVLVTGGSDNHICHVDLRSFQLDGEKVEILMEDVNIFLNKAYCPGDKSTSNYGGIRLGTPALTSRGFRTQDIADIANFLHIGIQVAIEAQSLQKKDTLIEFNKILKTNMKIRQDLEKLKMYVVKFSSKFDSPGIDEY